MGGSGRRADVSTPSWSEQVDPVLQQSVSGLAGQRERAVLVVRDARVPERSPVLLEVGLLGHAAGPVHSSAGTPAVKVSHAFAFQARWVTTCSRREQKKVTS